jgi:light-regulated signal transduction histidine kinase (bacteriophytochrome)
MQVIGPQNPPLDLSSCDREPIHIPGAIQAHGVLLAVDATNLTIAHVSANCEQWLRQAPGQLIGRALDALLAPDSLTLLRECLAEGTETVSSLRTFQFALESGDSVAFYASAHRSNNVVIIELERLPVSGAIEDDAALTLMGKCRIANRRLGECESVEELCQVVTQELCSLTNYHRIMVYQFDEEWNGAVIAEQHVENLEPYLGLHYPASDIPTQARAMFLLNGLRVIPDAQYQPVPLLPTAHPRTSQPLDLSRAHLRSVSPIHLEYLRNMKVGASLTISLVVDGKLWGLIACHHCSPRFVSPALREVCELFGQMVSMRLTERLQATGKMVAEQSKESLHRLAVRVGQFGSIIPALLADENDLLALTNAQGAILWRDGEALPIGVTPPLDSIPRFQHWVANTTKDAIFFTDCLPGRFQGAAAYADVASGMLALLLARSPDLCILWFLPELIRTVDWAGDPDKSIEPVGDDGRIHPRRSFARWKKSARHHSRPWLNGEIEAVKQLQTILQDQLARTAEKLQKLLPICAWCRKVRSDQD